MVLNQPQPPVAVGEAYCQALFRGQEPLQQQHLHHWHRPQQRKLPPCQCAVITTCPVIILILYIIDDPEGTNPSDMSLCKESVKSQWGFSNLTV